MALGRLAIDLGGLSRGSLPLLLRLAGILLLFLARLPLFANFLKLYETRQKVCLCIEAICGKKRAKRAVRPHESHIPHVHLSGGLEITYLQVFSLCHEIAS